MASVTVDTNSMTEVGENVLVQKKGNLLVIVVDTTVDIGPSKSGLMRGIASTSGFTAMPDGIKGNVWIGRKP